MINPILFENLNVFRNIVIFFDNIVIEFVTKRLYNKIEIRCKGVKL